MPHSTQVEKMMKTYSVPIVYTTTGWVKIEANSLEEAKNQAKYLNETGVEYFDIEDADCHSEVMPDEIEEIG